MRKFLISLFSLATGISLLLYFLGPIILSSSLEIQWIQWTNIFYASIGLLLFLISSLGFKKTDTGLFVKILGLNTFLRLLFSLGFTVIVLITNDLKTLSYVSANIILYFTYLAFEIRFLLTNLRPDSKERADVANANK
jgi:hypothetical protein